MSINRKVFSIIIFLLVFRAGFGLLRGFIYDSDHQFIYTLGLKFFTTGEWPFYGPDVVYTNSQIPGALQSLWIAFPLWIFPIPESPYFFYLLAIMFALSFLAWYSVQLGLNLPKEVIWIWVLTTPWSIFFGSTLINPGYVMIYAVFFMTALYEVVRFSKHPIIPLGLGFFLMGFTTTQIMQLHLSWVLLLPLIGGALLFELKKHTELFGNVEIRVSKSSWQLFKNRLTHILKNIVWVSSGLIIGGVTLYPTIIKYGSNFSGGTEKNLVFNLDNIYDFFKTLFNFLYFPSYQVITYFNFYSGIEKNVLDLWNNYLWLIPIFIIPFGFGFIQIVLYLWGFFGLVSIKNKNWKPIRILLLSIVFLTWASFFFNDSGNSAHKYFMFFPLTVIYSLYVLEWAWKKKFFRFCYMTSLVLMIVSHIVIAFDARYDEKNQYHFQRVRERIAKAIKEKDYTIYNETRYDHYTNEIFIKKSQDTVRPGY